MRYLTLILISLLLASCGDSLTQLQQVQKDGVLFVATRNSPTTYYEGPAGHQGLEYDLATRFADELGVELKIITPSNLADTLSMVSRGEVHFAAAGLTITEPRKHWVRFSPPYQMITQQLVYRMGTDKPHSIKDIIGKHIEVVANSSHVDELVALQAAHPDLEWIENPELESEELLNLVFEQVIDFSIADSNELALSKRFHPELRIAFNLTEPQPLAWAFPKTVDDSIYNAASNFIKRMTKSGELDALIARYYGHIDNFDYVGTQLYLRHVHKRLPKYQLMFEASAEAHKLDWRLLAAIGYQESHWNPKARSPTGVRGIMMLTLPTAKYLGVSNRIDPEQSIKGGSAYLRKLMDRIAPQIEQPDRTWFALAAYNVGLGHVEDARIITQIRGGNPDAWNDVKANLPLLSRKKWYRKTKHGYARGREPVHYVENIRSYFDILVWYSEQNKDQILPYQETETKGPDINSAVL